MPLPTKTQIQTLDYSGYGQPAAYLEAKPLTPSSSTLVYSIWAQPVYGISDGAPPPPPPPSAQNSNFLMFCGV